MASYQKPRRLEVIKLHCVSNWPCVEGSEMEIESVKAASGSESFSEVKRKRKRTQMDTTEASSEADLSSSSAKRPSFPPVNVSTSLVNC